MTVEVNENGVPTYQQLGYRWVIIILLGLTQIVSNVAQGQINALGEVLMNSMSITPSQFGMCASVALLGGAIFGIISGTIADKYGIKRIIGLFMVISVAGIVWRIFATNFASLFVSMFLCGLIQAATGANVAKIVAMWFSKAQAGVAMSIYIVTSTVGNIIALMTTGALYESGWSIPQIFTIAAVLYIIVLILWLVLAKDRPKGAPIIKSESMAGTIKVCVKSKNLWLVAVASGLLFGCIIGGSTYLVSALTMVKGEGMVTAGLWATASAVFFIVGAAIVPSIVIKTGYIKRGIIVLFVLAIVLMLAGWNLPYGVPAMIVLQLGVMCFACGLPLLKNYPAMLPEIPEEAVGTAGGLQTTFQNLCGFVVPSYVIGLIINGNMNFLFYVMSGLLVVGAIIMIFVPEIGSKGKISREKAAANKGE